MKKDELQILTIDSLRIGYNPGRTERQLLPPLSAGARKGELIAGVQKGVQKLGF